MAGNEVVMFKFSVKNLLVFFIVWGVTGFVMGTGVLMGPSRWVVDYARLAPENAYVEGPLIRAMILLLIVCSLALSLFMTKTIILSARKHVQAGLASILLLFLAGALFMWFNPKKFGNESAGETESSDRFTVGSYPDLEKLKELKKAGYTSVISLLHPAVVPFETTLIAAEEENAEIAGIEMIHLPMLPWISENKDSLSRLRAIAAEGGGRYYLHCYLGKDRVNVALKTIADADPSVSLERRRYARSLLMKRRFERGRIMKVDEDVFITPYPTREELFGYILANHITNIVSLLDPQEGNNARLLAELGAMLGDHGAQLVNCPISRSSYDPLSVISAVDRVKGMQGTVVVFDFGCPSFRTESFIQVYRKDKPAVPPSFLSADLMVGDVRHIAPNIVYGSRPENLKQFEQLEAAGLRNFVYVGAESERTARRDKRLAAAAEFDWRATGDLQLGDLLGEGGPWYIYGNIGSDTLAALEENFGPAYTEPDDHIVVPKAEVAPVKPSKYDLAVSAIRNSRPVFTGSILDMGVDFLLMAAPSPRMLVLLTPFCFFYTYVCAGLAGWLRVQRGLRVGYTRKVFHFTIFTMACLVQARGGLPATVLFGSVVCCFVMYAMLRGNGFAFYEAMARPSDEPHRTLYIFVPMVTTAIGGVIANIFFQPVAMIGYLVGGWGDAVGEPVGSRYGKHKYKVFSMMGVPATRSLEGSASVLAASFLASLLGLVMLGAPLSAALIVAAACAAAACITEALSTHGLDNLTVQVVACAVMFMMIKYTL